MVQGYRQVHTNIRLWECENASIEASAQGPKDMKMWGCKVQTRQTYQTCRVLLGYM